MRMDMCNVRGMDRSPPVFLNAFWLLFTITCFSDCQTMVTVVNEQIYLDHSSHAL